MADGYDISVKLHEPPDDLSTYFTTFYRVEIVCDGDLVSDALHPQWAGVRFFKGGGPISRMSDGQKVEDADMCVMGPSSVPVEFELSSTTIWGFGILPLGWATFMQVAARDWVNRIGDGRNEPDFMQFVPLGDSLAHCDDSEADDLARIIDFFRHTAQRSRVDEDRILAIHEILLDPDLPTVAAMAKACGISQRTLERTCRHYFGFAPKLLLRRQRLMRSLSSFMLDPSLGWMGAMDSLYYDQSHFVRDCREFLGMPPSEYAAREHPILSAFVRERMKKHGSAVPALDKLH